MLTLRPVLSRLLMACLAVMIIAGTLGMGATDAQSSQGIHTAAAATGTETMGHPAGCPSEMGGVAGTDLSHGDCAMTVCCFSELSCWKAERSDTLEPVLFALQKQAFVPSAEPDTADRPPILT